jgi:tetratricopeptide (TPR) repeat protein
MIEQLLRAENALALGLLGQAQQIYEQTLAHDPANAIALVGLSRVALERGDERASLGFARRALSIDPENGQAGRMVARLEEVIHERGDAIPLDAPSTTTPMPAPVTPPAVAQPAVAPPDATLDATPPDATLDVAPPDATLHATPPPAVPQSSSAAAPEVAPRRGLLRRLIGRS